jgi:hypothetical protein
MTPTNDERSVSTEEARPEPASPVAGPPAARLPRAQSRGHQHVRNLRRHQHLCSVCNHPDREAIEADFLRWGRPSQIAVTYNIRDRSSMYRHAHATGLFALRTRNLRWILERMLERVLARVHGIWATLKRIEANALDSGGYRSWPISHRSVSNRNTTGLPAIVLGGRDALRGNENKPLRAISNRNTNERRRRITHLESR